MINGIHASILNPGEYFRLLINTVIAVIILFSQHQLVDKFKMNFEIPFIRCNLCDTNFDFIEDLEDHGNCKKQKSFENFHNSTLTSTFKSRKFDSKMSTLKSNKNLSFASKNFVKIYDENKSIDSSKQFGNENDMKKENLRLKWANASLQLTLQKARNNIEILKATNYDLSSKIKDQKTIIDHITSENEDIRSNLKNAENTIQNLRKDNEIVKTTRSLKNLSIKEKKKETINNIGENHSEREEIRNQEISKKFDEPRNFVRRLTKTFMRSTHHVRRKRNKGTNKNDEFSIENAKNENSSEIHSTNQARGQLFYDKTVKSASTNYVYL